MLGCIANRHVSLYICIHPLELLICVQYHEDLILRAVNRTVYGDGHTLYGEYTVSGRTVTQPYLCVRDARRYGTVTTTAVIRFKTVYGSR